MGVNAPNPLAVNSKSSIITSSIKMARKGAGKLTTPEFLCLFAGSCLFTPACAHFQNKASAAEGFLLVLYRIAFVDQDFVRGSGYLGQGT